MIYAYEITILLDLEYFAMAAVVRLTAGLRVARMKDLITKNVAGAGFSCKKMVGLGTPCQILLRILLCVAGEPI
jgi:hypothetical protein